MSPFLDSAGVNLKQKFGKSIFVREDLFFYQTTPKYTYNIWSFIRDL